MPALTKGQEREEREKLGKGMLTGIFGMLFCWLPGLGILLAAIGYVQVAARYTRRHRARRGLYLFASLLILILCAGSLMGELWLYSRNPNILNDTGAWIFEKLTGQSSAPGGVDETNYLGGTDYGDAANPGLGANSGLTDPAAANGGDGDVYYVEGAMG